MRTKSVWMVTGLVAAVLTGGCALQDDIYTLDHRLAALERRNQEIEKQNRELEARNRDLLAAKAEISSQVEGLDQTRRDEEMALRAQYAALAAQVENLRQESQMHTGRLEEIEYLVQQKLKGFEDTQQNNQARMDRLATDTAGIQKRIDAVDQYLNLEGSQANPPKPAPVATASASGAGTASDQAVYLAAKQAFDEGRLEAAREGFVKLLADFPSSTHADNSQFWIGETYYREAWYEKAILEYQKVIEKYPSGNKVPAALLKQGLAFIQIGETNNARLVLKELVAKHPSTNEAGIARQKLESL